MKYEVVNERTPEDYTCIITCKVKVWHSFISGSEVTREYLGLGHQATKSGELEIYEAVEQPNKAPVFVRLSERQTQKLWKAILLYRADRKRREAEDKIGERYAEYFMKPITGPQTYR